MDTLTIARALDQADALLNDIDADAWDAPTPCARWSVRELADHLVALPEQFVTMASGRPVDWSAPPPHHDDPGAAFRPRADALIAALEEHQDSVPEGMMAGEFAVHTWDLATALGRDTSELDPRIAETGFSFMSSALTDDQRGDAFASAQPAPADANAYERLAAFAGREVRQG